MLSRRRGYWLAGLTGVFVLAVAQLFLLVPIASAVDPPPPGCEYVVGADHLPQLVCQTASSQPGTTTAPTTGSSPTSGNGGSGSDQGGGSPPTGPQTYPTYDEVRCLGKPRAETPPNLGVVLGNRTPTSVVMICSSGIDGGPPFYFWSTSAAPPPPVDLAALSRQARAAIPIPTFTLQFGPDAQRLAVNMTTTFAAVPDRSMNLAASASDRGITVTVTGRLVGMAWSPGEPVQCIAGDRKKACSGGQVRSVDCAGTACQYTYRWASSRARTGGAPGWSVTATATWQFTYTTTGTGATTTGAATATWTEPMPAGTGTAAMGEWATAGGFNG